MDGDKHPARVALEDRRDETIEHLTEAFSRDVIAMDEFSLRVDKAHEATTAEALVPLTIDLPASIAAPGQREQPTRSGALALAPTAGLPAVQRRQSQVVVAVMGGAARKGAWTPASKVRAVAVMGGTELDFREAELPPGITEVTPVAIMGGVDIVVPPDLAVVCDGIGVMGGFEAVDRAPRADQPDQPILKITGLALMGGVSVSTRRMGESARHARRRRNKELKGKTSK